MKAFVVYESMFGNTEKIAQAIAEGLRPFGDVRVKEVGGAEASVEDVDLLVVGGPTHAFGMTRVSTRTDAQKQAAHAVVSQRQGVREWLAALPRANRRFPLAVATFDTKIYKARKLPGAARGAAKALRRLRYRLVAAESFYVTDTQGPLLDGELERAAEWASTCARGTGVVAGDR